MAALRELLATFDIKVNGLAALWGADKQLKLFSGNISENIGKLSTLGTASAFAIREVTAFFKEEAKLGEELENTAKMTGLSTGQLQKWQYSAEMMGKNAEDLTTGFRFLNRSLAEAGNKEVAQQFAKLGINAGAASFKTADFNDKLFMLADGFQKLKTPAEKTDAAMHLFGRGGLALGAVLGKGREGLAEFGKEAEKAGFILGEDFVEAAKQASIEEHKLDWSWRAFKGLIAQELFPVFRNFVDLLIKGVGWFKDLAKHTTIVSSALTGLTALAGIKLFGSLTKLLGLSKGGGFLANLFGLAKLGAIIAAIAVIYLAWDDLFALFTGKKSEIGDIIDQVYGKGQSAKDVEGLKEAWKGVLDAILGAGKATGDWDEIWGSFKSTLMTDLGAIVHSIFTMITLLARAGQFVSTFASQAVNLAQGKAVDQKAMGDAVDEIKKAWKDVDFSALGGALTPALTKNLATSGKGKIEVGKGPSTYGVEGGQIGPPRPPVIHQTNHIHSTDPQKVQAAINQGTTDALAQNDLRHTLNASKNRAPAVSQ